MRYYEVRNKYSGIEGVVEAYNTNDAKMKADRQYPRYESLIPL